MPRTIRCIALALILVILVGGTAFARPIHQSPRVQGPIGDSTDFFAAAWDLILSYWLPGTATSHLFWLKDGSTPDPTGSAKH
jgi:hypothetical protein